MLTAYVSVTLLASTFNGLAALANLAGHSYPKAQADRIRIPHSWIPALGLLLGAGAGGLLAGFAVPPLGILAAAGLVLYFLGALAAHLRVHDRRLGPWAVYFTVAVAALVVNIAYHG